MLETIKRFLGIYNNNFDTDLIQLIKAGALDLIKVGIDIAPFDLGVEYRDDVATAIRLYVMVNFDRPELQEAYNLHKDTLRKCTLPE